jgi:hypothetical protein
MQLLRELIRQRPADLRDAARLGLMPTVVEALRNEDPEVREATLALLALMVQHPGAVQAIKLVRIMILP